MKLGLVAQFLHKCMHTSHASSHYYITSSSLVKKVVDIYGAGGHRIQIIVKILGITLIRELQLLRKVPNLRRRSSK